MREEDKLMKEFKNIVSFILAISIALCTFVLYPAQEAEAATGTKLVAFTFDDGPSAYTSILLDGLNQRGAKVTFFMNGTNGGAGVANRTSILTRIVNEGHQLANHTYSHHIPFSGLSGSSMKNEVSQVETYLFQAMGGSYQDMVRIPGGDQSQLINQSVNAPMIRWSVDTLDWKYRNTTTVYNHIMSNVSDGSIVLLHDLYPTSVQAALQAISTLQSQGYECVTVAELLRRRGITPVNGQTYNNVYPNGINLPAYTAPAVSFKTDSDGKLQVNASSSVSGLTYYFTTDGSMPNLGSKMCGKDSVTDGQTIIVVGIDKFGTRTPAAVTTAKLDNPYGIVFNAEYYANKYPDLKGAFGTNEALLLQHFTNCGIKEGRTASPVFSITYYMEHYKDLKNAFGTDRVKYIQHFLTCGMKEGRQGSSEFNVVSYLYKYPDLRRAFGNNLESYYQHYIKYGQKEGRQITGTTSMQGYQTVYNGVDYKAIYNFNFYITKYTDIKNAFGYDDVKTLEHFVKFGMKEGRQASEDFDVQSYKRQYVDLRNAFGSDLKSYYLHYINSGVKENRKGTGCNTLQGGVTKLKGVDYSAVYDFNYYITTYADIMKAFGYDDAKVLEHFVNNGMREGRQGNAEFNVHTYRSNYTDLQNAYGNNLQKYFMHYLNHGIREGRSGK